MKTLCFSSVLLAMFLAGCAVGWQINMPMAYSQAHSRGSSYNAADAKTMDISGTSEAFQQQRATTETGDALSTSVEADKATDVAAAKGQGQVATETAKAARESTGTASGDITPTSEPTKTTSVAPTIAVAPGGIAGSKTAAPAASPGTTTVSEDTTPTSNTAEPADDTSKTDTSAGTKLADGSILAEADRKGDGVVTCLTCGAALEDGDATGQCDECDQKRMSANSSAE